MKSKFLFLICSLLLMGVEAKAVELCGRVGQGEIVFGKAPKESSVKLNGEDVLTTEDGIFIMAFGRDEKKSQLLEIDENKYRLDIEPTKWNIQNIKGVPPQKVTPSDSDLEAIELERKLVRASLKGISKFTGWRSGFIMPVEGRISGEFGGQRIMNNVPKNPHQGMDIAAKEGTEVKASADGEVVLAYPDLFYSGNVVVIDHGFGLQTIYAHLKEIKSQRGDKVKQGDIIGLVGKTGRATGPHLHWGASLRGVRFNPQSLLDAIEYQNQCKSL